MSKTTNKFAPEVRERAVRMVLDHERDHASRWAAVISIAEKIGCAPQTLHEWLKKDRGQWRQARQGFRPRWRTSSRHWSVRFASCDRPTRSCARRPRILPRRSSTARSGDDLASSTITAKPMGSSRSASVLPIAPSTYHEHVAQRQDATRLSARAREDLELEARDRPCVRRELRGIRRAQGLAADDAGGLPDRPLHRRAADVRDGSGRRDPGQAGAHDHQRQGSAVPARPR